MSEITIEQFMTKDISGISQVYLGKDNSCRCGCGGEYMATSYMQNPRSEVNDDKVVKRLNRAKSLISKGAEYHLSDTYINVVTGNNRALTFYFDELR